MRSPSTDSPKPTIYLGRMARKRIAAAKVRQEIEQVRRLEQTRDKRNRISERIPMPRPSVIKEQLMNGSHYTLLCWISGRLIGEFAADREARCARQS